jgi:hypothetical protein
MRRNTGWRVFTPIFSGALKASLEIMESDWREFAAGQVVATPEKNEALELERQ